MPFQSIAWPIAALAGVLGLIWLIQRLVRFGRQIAPLSVRQPTRLRVVQSVALDSRRRVVLLACDERECLVLVGGGADLVLQPLAPAGGDAA